MSGLYLHIPFCKQACSYCDFYFVTRQGKKQDFVAELIKEIHSKKDTRYTTEIVKTVYFGGGTPSLLSPKQIEQILEAIEQVFELHPEEVTLEMNPDDVNKEYLADLRSAGITRASMGVQTFNQQLLNFMNRAHSKEEALHCLEVLSSSGIHSYTVDLIYGNPDQTLEMLEKDVDVLLGFNPPHVSAYSLTIEPKTRLGRQLELGSLIAPEDDLVALHFDLVEKRLREVGILQYEVSNFAKPGFEARHNSAYWSHENYLGLGPGAHSFWWNDIGQSAERWINEPDLNSYLSGGWENRAEVDQLSKHDLAEERLMLGLRTVQGLDLSNLEKQYDFKLNPKQEIYLHQKVKEGKAVFTESRLYLTKEGLKIADAITLDLLS
ncbi:MAG: radical SAM family heme chaperone HemW [Balneolaceae bacterium]|nr:radical SAM family heme chaperone HemW [Balneolaceae bacterium]MBO6545443.1 radical SAM family heme chaperone HemW [Balneolaceae bacterium]MBO6646839.1 radical SAM family heme chaperone HemW [Balneolaceae bacterium]